MTCCGQGIKQATVEKDSESELDFLLNKEIRSQQRLAICKQCPELIGPLNNCVQCGCFMNIKVRIYSATCPLGKW